MTTRAKSILRYNGLGLPAGYTCYANPFRQPLGGAIGVGARAPAGNPAKFKIKVTSSTVADFDGKAIIVGLVQPDSESYDSKTLTFDDDTVPPSTASSINISGLASVADIATQVALAFELAGFVVQPGFESDEYWIFQPVGGDHGNQVIEFTGDLSGEIAINGISDFVGFNVFMYGGNTLSVPLLWGPRRGMGLSTPNNVQFETTPV